MTSQAIRALLIEDNPADVRLLQEAIRDVPSAAVHLVPAGTLRQAIGLAQSQDFDVALLDLSLPDADGLESLDKMQRHAPRVPIVVLTGRDDSELAVEAVRCGAQDYLVKGRVDGHLLIRAMRYAAERQRTLEALQRSEEHFRSLIENALDIIMVLGADGSLEYGSPSIERVLGYAPRELVGSNALELLHPDDAAEAAVDLERLAAMSGVNLSREYRVLHKNGSWRVLEVIGRQLVAENGIARVILNSRDVTERKHSEERLRQLSERLGTVIDTSPLAIYTLDRRARVLSWNRAAEKTFGWAESEIFGRELPIIPFEFRAQLDQHMLGIEQGEALAPVETRHRRRDGTMLDVSLWAAALRDAHGGIEAFLFLVADTTARKRLEEQFLQAQKMEAIGRLAGGVAHDFNNLLTVITGYSQLVLSSLGPQSELSAEVREVLQAADRAAGLTRQLLAFSRRQVVELEIIDLNSLVSNMDRMLRRVIGEDVRLITHLSPDPHPVRADRGQIEQVLLNMAVNARDAMPHGGRLTIETANVELSRGPGSANLEGVHVMLAVSDTGTGIDPAIRSQIFEPFFTTKEVGRGTGLGLSTSYGIIRQHRGDIWIYSELGVGTTFKIYLPVAEGVVSERKSVEPGRGAVTGTETLLVVEDDVAVAKVMTESLRAKGYNVLTVNDPAEGIRICRDHDGDIHLLVSDMLLNTMTGIELAREIRLLRPGIPVLFVSGYTEAAVTGTRFLEPGQAFLQKPFTPEILAGKVREMLGDNRQPQEDSHG